MLLVLASALLTIAYYIFSKYFNETHDSKLWERIPGPPGWPLLKNLPELIFSQDGMGNTVLNFIRKYSINASYKGIFKMDILVKKVVFFNSPDSAQVLLTSTNYQRSKDYDKFTPYMGNGLFLSYGQKWLHDRKSLTAGFSKLSLDNYIPTLNEKAVVLSQQLGEIGTVLDVLEIMRKFSLESVLNAALEVTDMEESKSFLRNYNIQIQVLSSIVMQRVVNVFYRIDLIFNLSNKAELLRGASQYLKSVASGVFHKKRAMMLLEFEHGQDSSRNEPSRSLLRCLMKLHFNDPLRFDETAVVDHLNSIITGGNDTTSVSLCLALYYIATHEKCQTTLRRDIAAFNCSTITSSNVNSLRYLDAVLKETLRIYSLAPIITRNLDNDLKFGDYTIPKNSEIVLCIEAIHMDEQLYQNADKFMPERWLPGNEHMRSNHPFSYLPFSGGRRNCIAKKFALIELKLALIHIIRNFDVKLLTSKDLKLDMSLTLKPVSQISMSFKKRNK